MQGTISPKHAPDFVLGLGVVKLCLVQKDSSGACIFDPRCVEGLRTSSSASSCRRIGDVKILDGIGDDSPESDTGFDESDNHTDDHVAAIPLTLQSHLNMAITPTFSTHDHEALVENLDDAFSCRGYANLGVGAGCERAVTACFDNASGQIVVRNVGGYQFSPDFAREHRIELGVSKGKFEEGKY